VVRQVIGSENSAAISDRGDNRSRQASFVKRSGSFVGEELERLRELWLPDQRANRRNVGDAVGIWAEKNSGRLFIGAQTVEAAGRNSLIDGRDREALPSGGDRGREDDLGLQPARASAAK